MKDAVLTTEKTKSEIKKELEDTIANANKNENTDMEQMAKNCTASEEDAVKIIHKLEEIIRNKKKWHSMASLLPKKYISEVWIKRTICLWYGFKMQSNQINNRV